jgi:hypothetical protein
MDVGPLTPPVVELTVRWNASFNSLIPDFLVSPLCVRVMARLSKFGLASRNTRENAGDIESAFTQAPSSKAVRVTTPSLQGLTNLRTRLPDALKRRPGIGDL